MKEPEYVSRYSDGLRAGRPWFGSRLWQDIYLYSTASRPALVPNQPPIELIKGTLSPWVQRPVRKADHSPLPSAEAKNRGAIPPLPNMSSWHTS
jgi:hypothetical protein